MPVAKKDQERVTYAWMYGAQARKDGKELSVPQYWTEFADTWLQGFDGVRVGEPLPTIYYASAAPKVAETYKTAVQLKNGELRLDKFSA